MRFDLRRVFPFLVIALLCVAVYAGSLGNGFVLWDDDVLVFNNPAVAELSPATIARAFTSYDPELYVPLTIVSYQIEHAIAGFNPLLYHVNNLLLHIFCSFLVLALLRKLGVSARWSLILACVFAAHPLNAETVSWISARKDLLMTAFSLGSLLAYLSRSTRGYAISLGLFLCALLSKPTAILLPGIFLLIEAEGGRVDWKKVSKSLAPFVSLSLLFLVIALFGKTANLVALTPLQTVLMACKALVFAVNSYVAPFSLSFQYRQVTQVGLTPEFLMPVAVVLAALMLFWFARKHMRGLSLASGLFLLPLLPSFATFSQNNTLYIFSDRYLYLPQIGLLLFAGLMIDSLLDRYSRSIRNGALAIGVLCITMLGISAHARSLLWQDSESLLGDALRSDPGNTALHYNLGIARQQAGDFSGAEAAYRSVLQLDASHARAHANLGLALQSLGQTAEAEAEFRAAIAADPSRPEAYDNLGSLLLDRNDVDGAIAAFQSAIAADSSYAQAHNNLGSAYGRKGMYEEGLREFQRALELDPAQAAKADELRRTLEDAGSR